MPTPALSADDFVQLAAEPALRGLWPQRVTELVDVVQAAFVRQRLPAAQAEQLAAVAVLSVAFFIGGRQVYLPIGDRVKKAVQRRQIFLAWQAGVPPRELQQRFGVAHETVYGAIREGRARQQGHEPA